MYSNDLKDKTIMLYNKINSFRKTEMLINISKSTIHRWKNNISSKKAKPTINLDLIRPFVCKVLNKNTFITIKELKTKIYTKFKIKLSATFLYLYITKTLKFSYKKVNKKLCNGNIKKLEKLKKKFKKNLPDYKNIVCIDETYFYDNSTKNYGWSLCGSRLRHIGKVKKTKYSVIMAIQYNKILYYEIHKTNIKTNLYAIFIKKLCTMFTNKYILMDNVAFHKSKIINNIITQSNNKIMFIPPYSPEFNPIEEVFSQIKSHYYKYYKKKNFAYFLSLCCSKVKSKHIANFYKHSFA